MSKKDNDDSMQAVKESYRAGWLNSENKIFIKKLNHICDNYDENNKNVSIASLK